MHIPRFAEVTRGQQLLRWLTVAKSRPESKTVNKQQPCKVFLSRNKTPYIRGRCPFPWADPDPI